MRATAPVGQVRSCVVASPCDALVEEAASAPGAFVQQHPLAQTGRLLTSAAVLASRVTLCAGSCNAAGCEGRSPPARATDAVYALCIGERQR